MRARPLVASCMASAVLPATGSASASAVRVQHVALADGTTIAHYERGSGPPLLMNMGSASTMGEWDPSLLALLARNHRLILWDYRGVGLSRGSLKGLTIDRMADDGAALLTALGMGKAHVLGWSLGGFVAQRMAVRHAGRLRGVVLAGTNAGGSTVVLGPEWAQRVDDDPDRSDAQVLRVLFPLDAAGRRAGAGFLRRLEVAADAGTIPDDFEVSDRLMAAQSQAEQAWMASQANPRDLPRVRVPVLVAGGGRDVLTPPPNDAALTRLIPGARRVTFPRGGHAFLFQFRTGFAQQVARFTHDGG